MKNTDKTTIRRPRQRLSVKVVVEHEFIGEKTLADAFIPVIIEDLRRTFDNKRDTA